MLIVKKDDFPCIENDFVCSMKYCNFVIYYVIRCNYVLIELNNGEMVLNK